MVSHYTISSIYCQWCEVRQNVEIRTIDNMLLMVLDICQKEQENPIQFFGIEPPVKTTKNNVPSSAKPITDEI